MLLVFVRQCMCKCRADTAKLNAVGSLVECIYQPLSRKCVCASWNCVCVSMLLAVVHPWHVRVGMDFQRVTLSNVVCLPTALGRERPKVVALL